MSRWSVGALWSRGQGWGGGGGGGAFRHSDVVGPVVVAYD